MTEQELSQFYYLQQEVKNLEEKLAKLGYGVGSMKFSNEPKGSKVSDSIQEKITELKELWIRKRLDALETYIRINKYILDIDDAEIRLIATYRHLDLLTWDQITAKLGTTKDRSTIIKKYKKYLKNSPNSLKCM